MKKIMFNDRYGLTKAVLEGRKTMTRRIIKTPRTMEGKDVYGFSVVKYPRIGVPIEVMALDADGAQINNILPKYKVGEVVAVAQSYMDAGYDPHMLQFIDIKEPTILPFSDGLPVLGYVEAPIMYHAGWKNKMFVHPTMMPHQIRITNVRVERLQDISDEDVYKEGFTKEAVNNGWGNYAYHNEAVLVYYDCLGRTKSIQSRYPKEAFATLFDKVSGVGTWDSNPWVFVYEFELVK